MGDVVITGSNSGSEELGVRRSVEQGKENMEECELQRDNVEMNRRNGNGGNSNIKSKGNGMVKWDRLFPKMVLRVLLVEADDSTRQIIAALLKKCNYRVSAVSDGLKAWEMLKGRPHNIDLILTEVDLPAISGYALLTLVMEHDICKNIPVIMMSSENSISTVYKCMMRGACDYLVKPIRKNELRNLWQHVWRKRSSLAGEIGRQDESVGQDKAEATSENNAASNNSTGAQKSKDCVEKGSDAQSSCTKPEMEAENSPVEYLQDSELPTSGNFSANAKLQNQDVYTYFGHKFPIIESDTRASAAPKESIPVAVGNAAEQQSQRIDANVHGEAGDNYHVHVNSSREAIDFMGASTKYISSSANVKSKVDFGPHLDLTLKRSHPVGEIQGTEERHTLRHSDASAFTRYINRSPHTPHSTSASICDEKEHQDKLERRLSSNIGSHLSEILSSSPSGQKSVITLANAQKESEHAKSCPPERMFPVQIPVEGVNYNTMSTNYAAAFPSVFSRQGASPTPSPSSASQPESAFKASSFHHSNYNNNSEHFYDRCVQNAHDSSDQVMQKHDQKFDSAKDHGQISPTTDQSTNSSFCNGAVSIGYGSASGSNSYIDQVAMAKAGAENKNGEVTFVQNVSSHRSIQREAALTKFRLKRKERCYEKKVRYESRKRLAEQRPRVKGQFVRQVQAEPLNSEA